MNTTPPLHKTIIRPPDRWPGLGLSEAWDMRAICMVLVTRALKIRYRQTVIGAGWAIAQPLLLALVFSVFFGLFVRVPSDGISYPLFVFSGMVVWQLVSRIASEGALSVVANSALVQKIYLPHSYFPISVAAVSVIDLLFGLLALAVMFVFYQALPDIAHLALGIVVLPILTAVAMAAGLGIALWMGALNVVYRDVAQVLPLLVQLWFFLSPVIYPSSLVPSEFRWLLWLNPASLSIDGFRWILLSAPAPPLEQWLLGTGVAVAAFLLGYLYFRSREAGFVDVI